MSAEIELNLDDVLKFHAELEQEKDFAAGVVFVILVYWRLRLMHRFKLSAA